MEPLNFILKGGPYGDATSSYIVDVPENFTFKDLIKEVLKREEWGYIRIYKENTAWYDYPRIEYHKDKILSAFCDEEDLNKIVISVGAFGGWGSMDYTVGLKEAPKKTMMQDFFEKHPNAPKGRDGTPVGICPSYCGYTDEPNNPSVCEKFDRKCLRCWSRPMED